MKFTVDYIMKENQKRISALLEHYDPVRGVGSHVERFEIAIDGNTTVCIPVQMRELKEIQGIMIAGTLARAALMTGLDFETALEQFGQLRCKYDFEFWAATCVSITTKGGGDAYSGPLKKFILNRPQRRYAAELLKLFWANAPIYIILLKSRQWGGSTLTDLFMGWIQLFWKTGWNALIVAQVKSAAQHILGMYERMAENHPDNYVPGLESIKISNYQRTQNYKIVEGRECVIGVGSAEEPQSVRSMTYMMVHMSEVAFWKSTEKLSADEFVTSIIGTLVKNKPMTMCVKESTGNGVGNYFQIDYAKAVDKKSNYLPVFVSWFEDPVDSIIDVPNIAEYVSSWSYEDNKMGREYELFSYGASVEQVYWYMKTRADFPTEWKMKQEYPSTPEEAFQTTGRRVFDAPYVLNLRKTIRDPISVGNIIGSTPKGVETFKNIKFLESKIGKIKVWTFPHKAGIEDFGVMYKNRYCGFADIGGRTDGADYGCFTILDRIWTLFGGVPKVAAEWHGHLDQDLFAWEVCRMAWWYGQAYTAFEVNSLKKKGADLAGFDGDHTYTVLDEIKDYYPNLFYRVKPEQIQEKWDGVVGFHTNVKTKQMLIDNYMAAMRDDGYEEPDSNACDEADWYEVKSDGSLGAVDGKNDDRVISRSGSYWLHLQMPPVQEVEIQDKQRKSLKGQRLSVEV